MHGINVAARFTVVMAIAVLALATAVLPQSSSAVDPQVRADISAVTDKCKALAAEAVKVHKVIDALPLTTDAQTAKKDAVIAILTEIEETNLQAVITLEQIEKSGRFPTAKALRPGLLPFIFMLQKADAFIDQFRQDEAAPKTEGEGVELKIRHIEKS